MKGKILLIVLLAVASALISAAQESPIRLKVVTEQANIRQAPDIGSTILHLAPQGSFLDADRKEGDWYRVKIMTDRGQEVVGFVHESLVILVTQPKPSTPPVKAQPEPAQKEGEAAPPAKPPPVKKAPPPPIPKTKPKTEPEASESPAPPPERRPPFRFALTAGLSHRAVGDLNSGAQGLADFYQDELESQADTNIKSLHLTYIFGGEIRAELWPRILVSLGMDYFKGSRDSGVFSAEDEESSTYTTRPGIRAFPIRLGISYFVIPQIYLKGGVEYYFARCSYFYRFEQNEFWEEWQGEANSQGLGFTAGGGFEMEIDSRFAFFAEATGHLAKLEDFAGTNYYRDSEGSASQEDGTLYIYQGHVTEADSYPLVFIRERKPSEAGVSDPLPATLDFSGLVLRVGFIFRF